MFFYLLCTAMRPPPHHPLAITLPTCACALRCTPCRLGRGGLPGDALHLHGRVPPGAGRVSWVPPEQRHVSGSIAFMSLCWVLAWLGHCVGRPAGLMIMSCPQAVRCAALSGRGWGKDATAAHRHPAGPGRTTPACSSLHHPRPAALVDLSGASVCWVSLPEPFSSCRTAAQWLGDAGVRRRHVPRSRGGLQHAAPLSLLPGI